VKYDFGRDRARWSRELGSLFGWRGRDIATAEAFFRKVHRDDVARLRRSYREMARSRRVVTSWTLPFRLRRRDGRFVEVVARAVGLTGGPGPSHHVVGTIHDLTAVRDGERALRRSETLYRSVVGSLREGLVVLDPAGGLRDVNASARQLLRLPRGPLRGTLWSRSRLRWFHEDGSPLAVNDRPARLAQRTGETQSALLMGRWRQGRAVWLAVTAVPLPPCEDGEPQGVVSSYSDVTEAREATQALRRLSLRLLRLRDEEQRRIARELHDGVAQNLSAAALNLAVARREARRLPRPAARAIAESHALVERAGREVRTLSRLLHPPVLDEAGLVPALRGLCEGFTARAGVPVALRIPRPIGPLPRQVKTDAYRILQECLGNVLLHSKARRARVSVTRHRGVLRLEVLDDGRGIGKGRLESVRRGTGHDGIGVVSMRERAHLLGGKLEVESGRWGTCIRVFLPAQSRA
jgi:PAS domain S-box-containing protein